MARSQASSSDPYLRWWQAVEDGAPPFSTALAAVLADAGLTSAALLVRDGERFRVSGSWVGTGKKWPGSVSLPASDSQAEVESGPRSDNAWRPLLEALDAGRLLLLPCGLENSGRFLAVTRKSARAFPAQGRRGAVWLARMLAAPAADVPDLPPADVDESAFLLEIGRRLTRSPDRTGFAGVVCEAVARILDCDAVFLLGEGGVEFLQGGARLAAAGRRRFEQQVQDVARDLQQPPPVLQWPASPPENQAGGASAGMDPEVLALTGRRRCGALVLQPLDPPREDQRRLLAAVAGQAALALERLALVEARAEDRLASILEALPSGVITVDGQGKIRRMNPAGGTLLRSLADTPSPEGESLRRCGLPGAEAEGGDPVEFCALADQRTYVLRRAALARDNDRGAAVVVLSDVTVERSRQDQALQSEKMSALGGMLSGVAHELNNPLASVVGFSQLMERRNADPAAAEKLALIAREAQRCRRIVQNLLDVARVRSAERTHVNINDLVESVLELFAYQFRVENIRTEWLPAREILPVMGDMHQLRQVLVNLAGNAQHALKRVEGTRLIRMATRQQGDRVVVTVSDSGPGLPARHLQRIFDPFFTTKAPGVGTGLGLAIAARIVGEHGGTIKADSNPGDGAEFTVALPAHRGRAVLASPPPSHAPDLGSRRILVVDDEPTFRLLLEEALTEQGCRIDSAPDGEEALRLLAGARYDAVLCDLHMPVMGGRDLFGNAVHRWPSLRGRFIFVTGNLLEGETREFLDSSGAPVLTKPFGLQDLFDVLGRIPAGGGGADAPVLDSPAEARDQ